MLTNMACPKCGGRASEYDSNKWGCLECGNKFLYAPPPIPQTYLHTNINIQGSGIFDLDSEKAQPPQPVFEKKFRRIPKYFDEIKLNEDHIAYNNGLLARERAKQWLFIPIYGLLIFFMTVGICAAPLAIAMPVWVKVLLFTLPFVITANVILKMLRTNRASRQKLKALILGLENRNKILNSEKDDDVVAGYKLLCPHCSNCFASFSVDMEMPVGLQHCLSCGKQFFSAKGYAFAIATK